MRVKLPLAAHMVSLPAGSITAFRGQWFTRVDDHMVGDIPSELFELWQARFKAELVAAPEEPKAKRKAKESSA